MEQEILFILSNLLVAAICMYGAYIIKSIVKTAIENGKVAKIFTPGFGLLLIIELIILAACFTFRAMTAINYL